MSPTQRTTGWQAGFLSVLPAIATSARIRFRRLPAERREDAIQEAIASACVSYQLLAAKGKLHAARPTTLATFAVNFVRNGRHVGGRQDTATDPHSPACYKRHGISIRSYRAPAAVGGIDGWLQVAIAERKASIPDTAAFRIDFSHWLKTLNRRDRRIIAAFTSGYSTSAVAHRFGITPGRVSQLRRRYEQLWRSFQGEALCRAA